MDDSMLDAALAPEPAEEGSQPQAEPQAETAKSPERGQDGRFLPKASDAEPAKAAPEPAAAQAAPIEPPPPAHVPITAMLDEREKRQAAERRAAELQARWEEAQAASQPAPTPEAAIQAELYAQRLEMSRGFAEQRYGKDAAQALHDWAVAKCDADPYFNEAMRASRNPYEEAMQAMNREQIAAKVTPERLAAFEAWEAAQAQAQAQPQAQTPSPQAPPPRSLVNAPGAGGPGATPQGAHVPYEALPFN